MIQYIQSAWQQSSLYAAYRSRESGERRILLGLLVVVITAVLWLVVWKPVSDWETNALGDLERAQETLDYIKSNEAAARRIAASGVAGSGGNGRLMPIITRSASAAGLTLSRVQPESDGAVSVVVQGQAFDDLYKWMAQLRENNNIVPVRVSVDQDDAPGRVNAQVRFQ